MLFFINFKLVGLVVKLVPFETGLQGIVFPFVAPPDNWVSGSSHDSSNGNHSGESNQNAEVK